MFSLLRNISALPDAQPGKQSRSATIRWRARRSVPEPGAAHSKPRRRARERVSQRTHHAGVRRPGVRLPISAAPRTVVAVPHSADVRGRSLRRLSLRQRCDNRRAAGDRGGTDIRTSPGQPCYTSGMSLLEGSARGPAQDGNLAAKINPSRTREGCKCRDTESYALVTLALRRQPAQTRMRLLPVLVLACTGRRLTFQRRRVTLCAWLMLLPNCGPLPQISQTWAMLTPENCQTGWVNTLRYLTESF